MLNKENIEQILGMQEENYANRIGTVFGIFRIDDVSYNWVTHTQEWTVSCTKCGHKEIVPHSVGRDWQRGKGRSQYKCKFCKKAEEEKEKQNKLALKKAAESYLDSLIGTEINGWSISGRNGSKYHLFCQICGKERSAQKYEIDKGLIQSCRHPKDFSDPSYIGKKYGHLTVLEHVNDKFRTKCDCGFEKMVKPSLLEMGQVSTCGRLECEFHKKMRFENGTQAGIVRIRGAISEDNIAKYLEKLGYQVRQTQYSGDFGVDLLVVGRDGKLVALQIKNNHDTATRVGVSAVQEVFAGGKYYDCDKFGVISYTGYTAQAKQIADKLGVMLMDEKCELYDFSKQYNPNTKYFWMVDGNVEPIAETFRKNGWDARRIDRFKEMTYDQVKDYFDKLSIKKERVRICKEKGLSQPYIAYRMKKMGMTFEQAISEPKIQPGRPKNNTACE